MTATSLSYLAMAATLTMANGFGHSRLAMVSLGYTYRDMMKTSSSCLRVSNMGWDNDNFLESLGQGREAMDKANEEYFEHASDISKEQVERIKQQNENGNGSGGQMFQQMLERAQQQQNMPAMTPPESPPPPPAQQQQQQPPSLPAGFENLSVEAQAALFRELLNNKPNDTAAAPPANNYNPKGIGPDGRKIGRNRDADAVVNSADVYFAQLKLDSSVRNQARMHGDNKTADQVFADPRIQDIKLHVNPHMEEQRKKEMELLETAPEEMIVVPEEQPLDKGDTGVSYKEKLRAKKGPPTTTAAAAQHQAPPPPQVQTHSDPEPPQPQQQSYPEIQSHPIQAAAMEQTSEPKQSYPEPVEQRPQEPVDQRQQIRTLMGLLLKHRGGPGFGSGRLQGAEMERFDGLSDTILEQLRREAVEEPTTPHIPTTPQTIPTTTPPSMNAPASNDMGKMIAAVEGALQLYKNSPPELQVSLVGTIQATLVTALGTCNQILANSPNVPQVPDTPGASAAEQMNQMIGAVEGAFQLYKNSPPALQASLVGILQTTLLTAINTCNQILDSGRDARSLKSSTYTDVEPEVFQSSVSSPTEQSKPVMETTQSPPPQYDGSDENSRFFENVYQKLQAVASSEGKLGLRPDISPTEASALADDLAKVRALLVEELEHGIPPGNGNSSGSSSTSGANQKYQDMLARARAEKENQ